MDEVTFTLNNSPLPGERARPQRPRGEGDNVIVFVGLGSNLGERRQNILRAVKMVKQISEIRVLALSELKETKPVGPNQDQPDFLNSVMALETTLDPLKLLDHLLSIETRLGRVRMERWGPRIIDLDILLYGDQTVNHSRLSIPHPEIKNRPFVQAAIQELQNKGFGPLTPSFARPLPRERGRSLETI